DAATRQALCRAPGHGTLSARCRVPRLGAVRPPLSRRFRRAGRSRRGGERAMSPASRLRRLALPTIALAALIGGWQAYVALSGVPQYILPGPDDVVRALVRDWDMLS